MTMQGIASDYSVAQPQFTSDPATVPSDQTMSTQSLANNSHGASSIHGRLRQIDWRPILFKLTDATHGLGWSMERAIPALQGYLQFLRAIDRYPHMALVPSEDVDEVWHCHLLDTQKYAADCQWLFGRFIHHNPYLGTPTTGGKEALAQAWQETRRLLQTSADELAGGSWGWLSDGPSTCVLSFQDLGDRPGLPLRIRADLSVELLPCA